MSHDQRGPPDVLSSARPNGGGSRMSSQSILGHKRTGSGRIESKENLAGEDILFSSPDLSGGSGSKPRRPYSPIAQPHSKLHRNTGSLTSPRDSDSPRDTKIPRPSTAAPNLEVSNGRRVPGSPKPSPHEPARRIRQPIGLKAAFKLAEAQEARDRSGSWSSNGSIDLKQAFKMANAEANRVAVGSPSPAPRSYRRRESVDTRSNQYFGSPDLDLGQRLQKFDRNHQLNNSGGPLDGLFTTKGRVGPKVAETTTTLARKASNSSLGGSPEHRRDTLSGKNNGRQSAEMPNWNAARRSSLLPSIEFDPLPPVEVESDNDPASSPIAKPTNLSPEKSYNWDLDADFTAGDLQVSDSPRIKLGGNGTAVGGTSNSNSPPSRRSNDKLDKIRQLEIEAANADIPEDESSLVPKRTNSKLDEIRAREMVALSPRVMAASRLDEIRAKNREARSRSTSPEEARGSGKQSPRGKLPNFGRNGKSSHARKLSQSGEPISDTPITIFRGSSNEGAGIMQEGMPSEQIQLPAYDDSYDLLRRLARATSNSPSPNNSPQPHEPKVPVEPPQNKALEGEDSRSHLAREGRQTRDMRAKSSRDRLTVGFAGLHKVPSSALTEVKRQSLVNSETDPTDRIEAEIKLFAPTDNYSEKGSTRPPSPDLSEKSEGIQETPKPKGRVDPLTQPTPRVTGAYVETPATVKVERNDDWIDVDSSDTSVTRRGIIDNQAAGLINPKIKQEEIEVSDRAPRSAGKPLSAPTRRSKPRSKRRQPLINTANIPTVKEDLRKILREHCIDDSTLDDFDGLLDDQDIDADELEKIVDDTVLKIEEDLKVPGQTDRERELQAFDRMSKSLKTGLLGIRSAKQGIERLEDKVAHADHKGSMKVAAGLDDFIDSRSFWSSRQPSGQSAYVTWPVLYRRQPRFRFTPLGILTLIFAIWYAIESVFCFLYVDSYECPRGMTCDWSPNAPYFPYAAPFMLDEWATGGKGRAIAWRIGDEIGDMTAEVSDWATGHDFTKDEVMYMNIWERKRHRRRLHKKGLHWKWIEPAQFKYKFQAWRNSWTERQRAIEEGEPIWGDDSMSADEKI